MNGLKINAPCPVLLMRMEKHDGAYHCTSCRCQVIDYTAKNADELKALIKPGQCGIFTAEQLTGQEKQPYARQFAFFFLTLFSFFGFQVSPLKAQTPGNKKTDRPSDTTLIKLPEFHPVETRKEQQDSLPAEKPAPEKNRKALKRKKNFIGCPEF